MEPIDEGEEAPDRLPFSRAFAQAGFTPTESETWRRAGWEDATEAEAWHHLAGPCTPEVLRSLAAEGVEPAEVERVVRIAPELTETQLRARISSFRDLSDVEIDLRDRVRENLQLGLEPLSRRS